MRLVVRGEVKHALAESGHAVSVFFLCITPKYLARPAHACQCNIGSLWAARKNTILMLDKSAGVLYILMINAVTMVEHKEFYNVIVRDHRK